MMIRPTLLAARYILTGFTSGLTWRYRALVAELSLATVQCTVAALEAKVADLERKIADRRAAARRGGPTPMTVIDSGRGSAGGDLFDRAAAVAPSMLIPAASTALLRSSSAVTSPCYRGAELQPDGLYLVRYASAAGDEPPVLARVTRYEGRAFVDWVGDAPIAGLDEALRFGLLLALPPSTHGGDR